MIFTGASFETAEEEPAPGAVVAVATSAVTNLRLFISVSIKTRPGGNLPESVARRQPAAHCQTRVKNCVQFAEESSFHTSDLPLSCGTGLGGLPPDLIRHDSYPRTRSGPRPTGA